jgi:environmental stress-induced protein Ves
MMALHTRLLDRVEPQRWRNGGGLTRELFAWPEGDAWQLRISVADVIADGPFSRYDGVQRWFAVVHGDGVLLRFADRTVTLDAQAAPLAFDGAAAPGCELLGGATQHLNLMHRGGTALMQRARAGDVWRVPHRWRGVYSAVPGGLRIDGFEAATLAGPGLIVDEGAGGQRWQFEPAHDGAVFWLAVEPAATDEGAAP